MTSSFDDSDVWPGLESPELVDSLDPVMAQCLMASHGSSEWPRCREKDPPLRKDSATCELHAPTEGTFRRSEESLTARLRTCRTVDTVIPLNFRVCVSFVFSSLSIILSCSFESIFASFRRQNRIEIVDKYQ